MDEYWDPLRRKNVAATPEEGVRQWFIRELSETFAVPVQLMNSEVGFNYGSKRYRADILVWDRSAQPLAIVECKRPDVEITPLVAAQALRYDAVLSVRFIILTNGKSTYVFKRGQDGFKPISELPDYNQMTCQS